MEYSIATENAELKVMLIWLSEHYYGIEGNEMEDIEADKALTNQTPGSLFHNGSFES